MQTGEQETHQSLDIKSTGQSLEFNNLKQLMIFMDHQLAAYKWISNLRNSHFGNDLQQNVYAPIVKASLVVEQEESEARASSKAMALLRSSFTEQALPLAGSAEQIFLADTYKNHGETTAGAALAFMLGRLDQLALNKKEIWSGLLLAFNREQGVGKASSASARAAFDKLTTKMANEIGNVEKLNAEFVKEHTRRLSTADRRGAILLKWQTRGYRNALKKARRNNEAAIEELENVRKAYEEMMKLKAPVDYWRDKANQHRAAAEGYKGVLIKHGKWVGPSLLLILLAIASVGYFAADPSKPVVAQFVFAAVGALVTTVAFWAARIVVRLYMSEHHLAIDAEERATMAMTYLALTERGAAEEKDRALVLASLFRPTSDGIVKDDAAPEFSPAAIASKYLTR